MNSKKNFQNFKIQHDKGQINEGVDYVFTIKDKNLLDDSDGELDILENQILTNDKKFSKKKEINLEDEKKNNILSKYDEEKDDGFTLRIDEKEKFIEGEEDNFQSEENSAELDRIKEKFKMLKNKKSDVNKNFNKLNQTITQKKEIQLQYEKKLTNDYMTHEEFKTLKPDFKKKKIQAKKGIHSIKTEEELQNEIADHKYLNMSKPASQVYDEYDELNLFLEKQRNLTNKAKKIEPEIVLSNVLNSKQETNTFVEDTKVEIEAPADSLSNNLEEKNKSTEFISETTEFLKKIPSKLEIEENYKLITAPTPFSLKDAKSGTQSVVNIPLPSERLKFGVSSLINPNENFLNKKRENTNRIEVEEDETKSYISHLDNNSSDLNKLEKVTELEEPLVGKGIATALKVLRQRGVVGKKELIGRFKDRANVSNEVFLPKEELNKFYKSDIDLEYRDSKGRLLTPKEMFRQQCYIFHGMGPKRKKLEKKLIKEQLQEKIKNQDPSESKTFKYLKSFQKKTNSPYLVLQGKNSSLP